MSSAIASRHGVAVLSATDVIAGYRPDLPILHGISLTVQAGEVVTIIGPNGAGKSTFIKAVAGLVSVTSGSILLDGHSITGISAHQLAASGVGFVPQTANVFTTLSIHENLVMGGMSLKNAHASKRIDTIYQTYPLLGERRQEKAAVLSGGQRQILAVARALLTEPRLIMLDEPTAGLSPMAATELFAAVKGMAAQGVAVLMVEQNAKAALRISDRAYVLVEGQNRLEGKADALLQDEQIGEIFLGARLLASQSPPVNPDNRQGST